MLKFPKCLVENLTIGFGIVVDDWNVVRWGDSCTLYYICERKNISDGDNKIFIEFIREQKPNPMNSHIETRRIISGFASELARCSAMVTRA